MIKKKFLLCTHGTFHYFNLAQSLNKKKQLSKIVSGYPYFKLLKYNIPKNLIDANGFYQSMNFFFRKLGLSYNNPIFNILNWKSSLLVDQKSKKYLNQADVFLSLSGGGLNTGLEFKRYKKLYICERASSHILYANSILKKEYAKYGINFSIHNQFIRRELAEYKNANFVLVPSKFVQKTFQKQGILNTRVLNYPSDNTTFFPIKSLAINKYKTKKFKIVFVGGLTLRKGVQYLIEGFNQLKNDNFELHLIGTPSQDYSLFKNKINFNKTFVYGHLDQKKINTILNQCHVFVMPSIEEGAAISVAQAMSSGLPVIVTENTGWKEVVIKNKNGFVIPIMNSNKIYQKLKFCYENLDQLKKMSKQSLKYSKNKTWDKYVDELNSIVKEYS